MSKNKKLNEEEQLKINAEKIKEQAKEIDDNFKEMSAEEQKAYVEEFEKELGVEKGLVSSDLPASQIVDGISVRVVDQVLARISVSYKLMRLRNFRFIKNGIIDVHYEDYTDTDNTTAYSDVEIKDFNQGSNLRFRETYQVDTDIHKGYDILSNVLNDITISVGLFVALLKDYEINIGRPIAKIVYTRLLDFFDKEENYDFKGKFTDAEIKNNAKELMNKLLELQTPSRNHLTIKPNGATNALEYQLKPENTILVLNSKYATNYKYDLTSGTYQLGEIKLPVNEIIILDFTQLEGYFSTGASKLFKDVDAFIIDQWAYNEIGHYNATTLTKTPKLKSVLHTYIRVGNYKDKAAFMGYFKNSTATK